MPVRSREVLTLRLVVECQLELPQNQQARHECKQKATTSTSTGLLGLPVEVRLKILRTLLLFDNNFKTHTRRLPSNSIPHLLSLDSRRILEAPQFKHKGKQEINGVLPTYTICNVNPSILRVCRTLYWEGCSVLYGTNLVAAVQSGISGLGSRLRNYGVKVWGPLDSSRITAATDGLETGNKDAPQHISFKPLITFRGQNSKPGSPVYICSQRDITHLIHALWILIKCPFARGMKFTLHVAPTGRQRLRNTMDSVVRFGLLPWMHNHVEKITTSSHAKENLVVWTKCLATHRVASVAEPNVYTYHAVCTYLEQLMASAERAIEAKAYTRAETLHELVCYEACSIVRTRTGKLVDVSTKTKDGINRVCKLIAVSAFRLCELRSGAIVSFRDFMTCVCVDGFIKTKAESDLPDTPSVPPACPLHWPESLDKAATQAKTIKTTRLDKDAAVDHAILSALLALRLPCATPVPEWNIRLNQMLLYLFNLKGNKENAKSCIRRLHQTCSALWKDASAKGKTAGKWTDLEILVADLKDIMDKDIKGGKNRAAVYQRLVEETQDMVRKMWGERLTPRKGYVGLIWTFRWA